MPVSELRFNLPIADLFKSSARGNEKHGGKHHQYLSGKPWKVDSRNRNESMDESRGGYLPSMDLSLGREKAGGGNTGKRAKLGKLIVHNHGLKMLDLVVAANIGIWWASWSAQHDDGGF
jgi:hypothetical protein